MFTKKLFGERLAEVRQKNGETQDQLGVVLGIRKAQVSQIENGVAATTLERFAQICEYYEVSSEYLLGLTDDPTPHARKV